MNRNKWFRILVLFALAASLVGVFVSVFRFHHKVKRLTEFQNESESDGTGTGTMPLNQLKLTPALASVGTTTTTVKTTTISSPALPISTSEEIRKWSPKSTRPTFRSQESEATISPSLEPISTTAQILELKENVVNTSKLTISSATEIILESTNSTNDVSTTEASFFLKEESRFDPISTTTTSAQLNLTNKSEFKNTSNGKTETGPLAKPAWTPTKPIRIKPKPTFKTTTTTTAPANSSIDSSASTAVPLNELNRSARENAIKFPRFRFPLLTDSARRKTSGSVNSNTNLSSKPAINATNANTTGKNPTSLQERIEANRARLRALKNPQGEKLKAQQNSNSTIRNDTSPSLPRSTSGAASSVSVSVSERLKSLRERKLKLAQLAAQNENDKFLHLNVQNSNPQSEAAKKLPFQIKPRPRPLFFPSSSTTTSPLPSQIDELETESESEEPESTELPTVMTIAETPPVAITIPAQKEIESTTGLPSMIEFSEMQNSVPNDVTLNMTQIISSISQVTVIPETIELNFPENEDTIEMADLSTTTETPTNKPMSSAATPIIEANGSTNPITLNLAQDSQASDLATTKDPTFVEKYEVETGSTERVILFSANDTSQEIPATITMSPKSFGIPETRSNPEAEEGPTERVILLSVDDISQEIPVTTMGPKSLESPEAIRSTGKVPLLSAEDTSQELLATTVDPISLEIPETGPTKRVTLGYVDDASQEVLATKPAVIPDTEPSSLEYFETTTVPAITTNSEVVKANLAYAPLLPISEPTVNVYNVTNVSESVAVTPSYISTGGLITEVFTNATLPSTSPSPTAPRPEDEYAYSDYEYSDELEDTHPTEPENPVTTTMSSSSSPATNVTEPSQNGQTVESTETVTPETTTQSPATPTSMAAPNGTELYYDDEYSSSEDEYSDDFYDEGEIPPDLEVSFKMRLINNQTVPSVKVSLPQKEPSLKSGAVNSSESEIIPASNISQITDATTQKLSSTTTPLPRISQAPKSAKEQELVQKAEQEPLEDPEDYDPELHVNYAHYLPYNK